MTSTPHTRALGARLLAEANDIKRTPESLAAELQVPLDRITAAVAGELSPGDYRALFTLVAARYPVALNRLWVEPSDTDGGVLRVSAADSAASSRIFARPDRTGQPTPYYEYRDTAMSRTAPFRPEWIRMLRAVDDVDPGNPDVAYNKGHALHQTTLFVGPVNFYWEANGTRHAAALDTGDSNYITPFWPHSFATRDPSRPAFIVAVTYGAEVTRARDELARLDDGALTDLVFDLRHEGAAHAGLLARHLAHESLPRTRFVDACVAEGLEEACVVEALDGRRVPSPADLARMARVLGVRPRDLMPPTRSAEDEVIVARHAGAETYPYPDAARPCYRITPLVRARHQPSLKCFLVHVIGATPPAAGTLRVPLHQYVFNLGDAPVRLVATDKARDRVVTLAAGDSAYVAPMVSCRFEADPGQPGELYVVRVPGDLHPDAVFELSSVAPSGIGRSATETTRWF